MWFKDARAQKIPISGSILHEKAKECATGLGIDDFQFSDRWLHGFKRHYDIQFRVISGEYCDVTTEHSSIRVTVQSVMKKSIVEIRDKIDFCLVFIFIQSENSSPSHPCRPLHNITYQVNLQLSLTRGLYLTSDT